MLHFILMNDLDFANDSDYESIENKAAWTTGQGWVPIGTDINDFRGVFDGNTKVITGLMINKDTKYIGLFGYTGELAELKDGCLLGVSITGTQH